MGIQYFERRDGATLVVSEVDEARKSRYECALIRSGLDWVRSGLNAQQRQHYEQLLQTNGVHFASSLPDRIEIDDKTQLPIVLEGLHSIRYRERDISTDPGSRFAHVTQLIIDLVLTSELAKS